MQNFKGFNLPTVLDEALEQMGYNTPTPIQAGAIPHALEGKDVLGSANTGTGKTAAFAIPMITHLINHPQSTAIVLTPTRELAGQIMEVVKKIAFGSGVKSTLIIGGDSIVAQLKALKMHPRIIVGTPGRVNDHLRRGSLKLDKSDFLVLDETDRMLDMGFGVQIDEIIPFMNETRQTLMFSATMPKQIVALSKKYLVEPVRVAVDVGKVSADNIEHKVLRVKDFEKYEKLVEELNAREGSVIIFVKTKIGADKLAVKLCRDGIEAEAIHGDLRQNRREKVIRQFRNEKYRILVATDVASRGLDIPHIQHVVNYDLPQVPEDYIHRIGRTARAGAKGEALCLVTPENNRKWGIIERMLGFGLDDDEVQQYEDRKPRKKRNKKDYKKKEKAFATGELRSQRAPRKPVRGGRPQYEPSVEEFDEEWVFEDKPKSRARREDRDFDDKPRSRGRREDRNFDDKPRSRGGREDRNFDDKPRSRGGREDRNFDDKPRSRGGREDRNFDDKPRSRGGREDRRFDDKPRSRGGREDRNFGDKPRSRGGREDRRFDDKPRSRGGREDRNFDDKPRSRGGREERRFDDKPRSRGGREDRNFDDKPRSRGGREERRFDDKPRSRGGREDRNFDGLAKPVKAERREKRSFDKANGAENTFSKSAPRAERKKDFVADKFADKKSKPKHSGAKKHSKRVGIKKKSNVGDRPLSRRR